MTDSPNSLLTEKPLSNHFKLINLWQSSDHKRAKYWLARSCSANPSHARRIRDWRLSKIERCYNLQPVALDTLIIPEIQ